MNLSTDERLEELVAGDKWPSPKRQKDLASALLRARQALKVAEGGCANCATCTNDVCVRVRTAALADSELEEAL